jgi:hypothetical protein
MTVKLSTGLRNGLLVTNGLKQLMAAGFINIYAGTVPASADAALGGATLLSVISISGGGTGINLATTAAGGVVSKASGETWSDSSNNASGTATFFRYVAPGDDGTLSTTQYRIQGTVGLAGEDLNLSSVTLSSGAPQNIDFFNIALPTL